MSWGGGDEQKYMIADRLTGGKFLSEAVIFMDSVVVLSLFGQLTEKGPGREHLVRVLALNMDVDLGIRQSIQEAFNAALSGYNLRSAITYQSCVNTLTKKLWRGQKILKTGSQSVLEWFVSYWYAFQDCRSAYLHIVRCLTAYPLVILEDSVVRLRVIDLGLEGKGFGVFAHKDIFAGEIIYELPGLVAVDPTEEHSHLSAIVPHPGQRLGSRSRIFFGPIRFINHRCHLFNVGVSGC
jgi:hypothetical protein